MLELDHSYVIHVNKSHARPPMLNDEALRVEFFYLCILVQVILLLDTSHCKLKVLKDLMKNRI